VNLHRNAGILMTLGGLVLAAALASFFLRPAIRTLAARSWPTSSCLVRTSQMRTNTRGRRPTYSADVLYSYEVAGRQYESNRYDFLGGSDSDFAGQSAIAARYRPGTRVDCYVDPQDPTAAVLSRSFRSAYLFGLVPLALLLAMAIRGARRLLRGSAP
jgi:hypothetical protein